MRSDFPSLAGCSALLSNSLLLSCRCAGECNIELCCGSFTEKSPVVTVRTQQLRLRLRLHNSLAESVCSWFWLLACRAQVKDSLARWYHVFKDMAVTFPADLEYALSVSCLANFDDSRAA